MPLCLVQSYNGFLHKWNKEMEKFAVSVANTFP